MDKPVIADIPASLPPAIVILCVTNFIAKAKAEAAAKANAHNVVLTAPVSGLLKSET